MATKALKWEISCDHFSLTSECVGSVQVEGASLAAARQSLRARGWACGAWREWTGSSTSVRDYCPPCVADIARHLREDADLQALIQASR